MPKIDLEQENVWNRQPDEEEEAFRAFCVYRDLGVDADVADACRRALGREPTEEELAQWEAWAEDWQWVERTRRYEASADAAAARARELAERWRRAREFYDQAVEPTTTGKRAGKVRFRPFAQLQHAYRRWARERAERRYLAAQEAAARRSHRPKKKRTLAERWTLFLRSWRGTPSDEELKGFKGAIHRTKLRINNWYKARPGRFLLIFAVLIFLLGNLTGMLFLRWRRIRYQHAVVFTVNETNFRRNEFTARLEAAAARQVMQDMVGRELRRQFAKKKKAYPTEKEVDERLAEDEKQPNFAKTLAALNMTREQYRDAIRDEIAQANLVSEGVTVTDEEVRKFYERNVDKKNPQARFYVPETIMLAVIGTRTRQEAEAALADLRKGIPWEEVARTHSQDITAMQGGILPPVARGRTMAAMIPGMEATVFAMEPGQRIGPVKFGEGWWIIQCRDKAPEMLLTFDQVRLRARMWARMEKGIEKNGRRIANEFAEFERRARIQIFDPFFRGLMAR